ncbi:hypothetical protein QE152_g15921 [Popillia japonica]|uniref:Uncharacterized protein n=1 Tax=Popillia japonica TaxID=7064 RepID=A0AAW1L6S1_POPJA
MSSTVTRSQKNKGVNNNPVKQIANRLNSSYITIISNSEEKVNSSYITIISNSEEKAEETDKLMDLQNKLAQTEFEMTKLSEEKVRLENDLQEALKKIKLTESIVDGLRNTIKKISKSREKVETTVGTQTDLINVKDKSTQKSEDMSKKEMRTEVKQNKVETEKPRIIILSDSHGRYWAKIFTEELGHLFRIESIFKPNAKWSLLGEDLHGRTWTLISNRIYL